MAKSDSVLDIKTDRKRKRVTIDGKNFEMLSRDEIDLAHDIQIKNLCQEMAELKDEVAAADASKRLHGLVRFVLPALDDATAGKLADGHASAIILAFLRAPGTPATEEPQKQPVSSPA